MSNNVLLWLGLSLPIYLVGAWTISGWLYQQVISGIHMYQIYKIRKHIKEDTNG